MENLDYLLNYLLGEIGKNIDIPSDINEKKKIYRILCNIRKPNPISEEYLNIEDKFLQEEMKRKELVKIEEIKTIKEENLLSSLKNNDKICIWQGDITKVVTDCIINPANSQGLGCFQPLHNCLDNQINTYAGIRLRLECNEIMKLKSYKLKNGEAIITRGYNLPAKYVIHTVGPMIYTKVLPKDEIELANCYKNSLKLAIENNIRNIVFPCISTGVFRFPKDLACKIAINTVDEFLTENNDKIDKVVFSLWTNEDMEIYKNEIK
jgi:O-acetyl-ADP-ribose deacetylase (regulator of RNase III)